MMKHLLPPVTYYKANFHAHSTVSDGKLTPEELRDAYKEKGYSILALTDHSVMVAHQELNQEDFLMLTGVEIDVNDSLCEDARGRDRHFCLISKDPKLQWIPYRDPTIKPNSVPYEALNEIGDQIWEYSAENINKVIAECNRKGCFVIYNHPCWSLENYPDYAPMKGLWGMEYRNSCGTFDQSNWQVYQDLLMLDNRIVPVCADDIHRPVYKSGAKILGANWTMIGAETLTYDSVIEAMERKAVYSSCGPEIHSLTWEDGVVRITCSPCRRIHLFTHTRFASVLIAQEDNLLTEAKFDMSKWLERSTRKDKSFFRLTVTDGRGDYAVTRAYWLDEIEES